MQALAQCKAYTVQRDHASSISVLLFAAFPSVTDWICIYNVALSELLGWIRITRTRCSMLCGFYLSSFIRRAMRMPHVPSAVCVLLIKPKAPHSLICNRIDVSHAPHFDTPQGCRVEAFGEHRLQHTVPGNCHVPTAQEDKRTRRSGKHVCLH